MVDWRTFDIGRDHAVRFEQPVGGATLNRIGATQATTIAGQISAPGLVILQNTAGVVFTGTARVDVGSLVATSQHVDSERFFRTGTISIEGGETTTARVTNEGKITVRDAGLAALVGGRVENTGTIVARQGTIALASGQRTTIDFTGDGLIRFAVGGDAAHSRPGVVNNGTLDAAAGRVLLSAGAAASVLDSVVNTSGVIRVASLVGEGGSVELVGRSTGVVHSGGVIDASGAARGGRIAITGERVVVAADSRIAARGIEAGGEVRVGGDRQGRGAMRRSQVTEIEAGSRIDARPKSGEGGSVVIWSDGSTRVAGTILAGGPSGGGFVETSGIQSLNVDDGALILPGVGGKWLLDAPDVRIAQNDTPVPPGGGAIDPPGASARSTVSAGSLTNALNADATVVITTEASGTRSNNITVDTDLRWTGSGSLGLRADGSVFGRSSMESRGTGALTLQAQRGNVVLEGRDGHRSIFSTTSGNFRAVASNGSVLIGKKGSASGDVVVTTDTGRLTVNARNGVRIAGGNTAGSSSRLGSIDSNAQVVVRTGSLIVVGGTTPDARAQIVGGPGGSLRLNAKNSILVQDRTSSANVSALRGATLAMRAPTQTWNGLVESRGNITAGLGGSVRLVGAITTSVAPNFNLASDANFRLGASANGSASSLTSANVPFAVRGRDHTTIKLGGEVRAPSVLLRTHGHVRLNSPVVGTGTGDAVVIQARALVNNVGSAAVATTSPDARWLVYLPRFHQLIGDRPAEASFDLYGRTLASDPPANLGFSGNHVVYREQPVLTVTAGTLTKTYGDEVGVEAVAAGLRSGDNFNFALNGLATASSEGALASTNAGLYLTTIAPLVSPQGYRLVFVDGLLAVQPAPLTVQAQDVTRSIATENPTFGAVFTGLRLGQSPATLGGSLGFSTPATSASASGVYAVTPGGLTSSNYAITYLSGTLTVVAPPLTVVAPPLTVVAPPLTVVAPPLTVVTPPSMPAVDPQGTSAVLGNSPIITVGGIGGQQLRTTVETLFARGDKPNTPGDAAYRTTVAEVPLAGSDPFRLGYSLGVVQQLAPAGTEATAGFVPAALGNDDPESTPVRCGGPINLGPPDVRCVAVETQEQFWGTFSDLR